MTGFAGEIVRQEQRPGYVCTRCGHFHVIPPDEYGHPYGNVYMVNVNLHYLCTVCNDHAREVMEHFVGGALVQVVDDDGRIWAYALQEGKPHVKVPE